VTGVPPASSSAGAGAPGHSSSSRSAGSLPPADEERVAQHFERAERQREATAYHEAAHVCAAWLGGLGVANGGGATIKPGHSAFGHAATGREIPHEALAEMLYGSFEGGLSISLRTRRKVEAQIIATLAGDIAEARALEEGLAREYREPPSPHGPEFDVREAAVQEAVLEQAARKAGESVGPSDSESVARLLREVSSTQAEADAYGAWLVKRTLTLVSHMRFWIPCCALAEALLEDEELSGRRCLEVLRGSLEPKGLPSVEPGLLDR
jgi:hypothetical protein